MSNNTGKPGTLSESDFEELSAAHESYGGTLLAQKVAKICSKQADRLLHELPQSHIGSAWKGAAGSIVNKVGNGAKPISKEVFANLVDMVLGYGPEVVVQKIAKLSGRAEATDAVLLKSVFPKIGSSTKSSEPVRNARRAAA